jgi:hypothetical protein
MPGRSPRGQPETPNGVGRTNTCLRTSTEVLITPPRHQNSALSGRAETGNGLGSVRLRFMLTVLNGTMIAIMIMITIPIRITIGLRWSLASFLVLEVGQARCAETKKRRLILRLVRPASVGVPERVFSIDLNDPSTDYAIKPGDRLIVKTSKRP